MTLSEILNLIALVVIPIGAVLIGRWLQDRSEKRRDKMNVFQAVMTFRYGWSKEGVEALNIIPVVYCQRNDKEVRECWKRYYDFLCIQNPDGMQIKHRNDALCRLIESMAKVLGYKKVLTWEEIQNPYIPVGMVNAINNSNIIQSGMANIVQTMVLNPQACNPQKEGSQVRE